MVNLKIAIIGLGYVGLPLAVEFCKKYTVIGFDIDNDRIEELQNGHDRTQEVYLSSTDTLYFSSDSNAIKDCNVYIITVPTPIDVFKKPDLTPLRKASETVGRLLKIGNTVIYESTVYPGCTEDDCVPILEKYSGLKFNQDFFCGYSPERINPGDKEHTLTKIVKITSGSTPKTAEFVDNLYASIIKAGTYKAPSIKIAEAAKLIENCQRDVNISFVNELALIFDRMNIDTTEVLEAAGTKWNFLPFKPGLVGGHCIGVDPYYMIHKAESLGYFPAVIGAGRRINDNMGIYVAKKVIDVLNNEKVILEGARILILGFTYKANISDFRNTKIIDVYSELISLGLEVDIYDPLVSKVAVKRMYDIDLIEEIIKTYDFVILAVTHDEFKSLNLEELTTTNGRVLKC